jgi:membrane-associated HD superfamily phosphohydrolase
VLTCGPGSELFTAFGHSALRLHDPILKIDKVYNYGTFDFNAPNFYLNFAKGKLIYQLSVSHYKDFIRAYQYEKRWVESQLLDLSFEDIQLLYAYLEKNARPENRSYQYDFFFDNCSTKIEEVLASVLKDKVSLPNDHIISTKTHRDLIADYTKDFKWGKFGIDLALGSVIDRRATSKEHKFLPDFIKIGLDEASISTEGQKKPLVGDNITILKEADKPSEVNPFSPMNLFIFIGLIVSLITYKNFKTGRRTRSLDFIMFLFTGLVGVVVLLLWFATNHTSTYENFNFLWAFAPNLLVALALLKKTFPSWIYIYTKLLMLLLGILLILWIVKVQVFNIALIPLIMALLLRYAYLISIKNQEPL